MRTEQLHDTVPDVPLAACTATKEQHLIVFRVHDIGHYLGYLLRSGLGLGRWRRRRRLLFLLSQRLLGHFLLLVHNLQLRVLGLALFDCCL
jgi:hypothetical protein